MLATSATSTIRRAQGHQQILDRTIADRRERGGELAALRTTTSSQIAQVAAARNALRQLREGIWTTADQPPT